MPGKSVHIARVIVQPSFPNNKLSTRPRRKKVVKRQEWKEEESPAYFEVPNNAITTPYDLPNPTDNAPSSSDYWLREENGQIMQEFPFGELMPFGAGGLNGPLPGISDKIPDYWEAIANTTARTDENHPLHWYCGDNILGEPKHNWTEISNQFNAFMQENIPPKIESVEIHTWDD